LRHLLQSSGRVVTREELCATLWPADTFVDFDLGLNTAVKKLRQALDDPAERPRYIETVHRRGYRFKFPVEWASNSNGPAATTKVEHAEPASVVPPIPSDPKPPEPRPPVPWKLKALTVLAGCFVVAGLLYPWMAPRVERQLRLLALQRLTVVPLTTLPGNVASPTFSPDGSQIAFAWDGGKGGNQSSDLYVKVIGSEKLLRITSRPGIYYAAWSPNGQRIAIERMVANRADSGVYLISPLGGPERKITNECVYPFVAVGAIAWSPDGKQLVCVTITSPTTSALLLLGVDSQHVAPLKTDCKRPISPAFSADGVYLAWICSEVLGGSASIQLQRLGEDKSTQLLKRADGIGKPVWSEDGRRMVFTSPILAGDIWEVSLGNPNGPERLPVGHEAFDLTVSSKAKRLAFAQSRTNVNIWRLELGAIEKHARMVIASTREQTAPDISPNGDQVAFESNRSGSNEVWVSDPDGSNALQLSSFGIRLTGSPRWSPDGKLIAFDSRAGGESNIYLVDPHSGIPHKVEIDIHGNSQPSWSHDGKWIYFVNGEDVQHPTGWKVSSAGGHAVPITDGPVMKPIESPDGSLLYFVRDSSLYSVRIDGTTAEKVEGMPLVRIDLWTPVESGFYFVGYPAGRSAIEFFDLKTRGLRTVYVFEKPLPGWVGAIPVSRDGTWLLFPQLDEQSSDLMLVENWR
jgi:Tol biopolymer transport system component